MQARRAVPLQQQLGRYNLRPRQNNNNNNANLNNNNMNQQQQQQPQQQAQQQQPQQQQQQQLQQQAHQQQPQQQAQQQPQQQPPQQQQLQQQGQQQQPQQQQQVFIPPHVPALQQRGHINMKPPKFCGTAQENGWYWLNKFVAYCHRAGIDAADDDTMIENFMLSISGSAETWFMLLPDDQRDTFDHLQEAFLRRYDNPQNNFSEADTFYSRKQQLGESVAVYIDEMMNLGAKLHIGVNEMVATIKRGLLDPIKMHVMTRGVEQPYELIQQATLAENYYIKNPLTMQNQLATARTNVRFDLDNNNTQAADHFNSLHQATTELKNVICNLTQQVEKISINTLTAQQPRSRSTTPFRNSHTHQQVDNEHRRDNSQSRYDINSTLNVPYCTFCSSQGHLYDYCKLRQQINRQRQQTQPPRFTSQQNQQDRGRSTQRQYFGSYRTYVPQHNNERPNYYQPANRNFYSRNNNDNRRYPNNNNYQHLN